jgi:WD40 repeat protein/Tfp pilus assembly protein PilF/predicted Ser/Thr protein kinase
MGNEPTTGQDDDRLHEAIAAFEEARDAGLDPDPEEWLRRYPEVADRLADFFAARNGLQQLATPLLPAAGGADPPPDIPGYELLEVIGPGGMGLVYKARQRSTGGMVALKVIRADRLEGPSPEERRKLVERFITEAQAAARLEHENIVKVYQVGEWQGRPFYTMRYVEGRNLDAIKGDSLEPRRAAAYLEQVARGVHEAHRHAILHRDLKPANILVDARTDRPLVADFGLAKLLEAGQERTGPEEVLGTPPYMSPEQAQSPGRVTVASDVYSLGATLYALLTGQPPFLGQTVLETLRKAREEEAVPPRCVQPAVPRDLDTICLRCLEKEPRRRYQSAAELADRLRLFLDNRPIPDRPVGNAERLWRWCRRNPAVAALSFLAVLLLLLALGIGGPVAAVKLRVAWADSESARDKAVRAQELADEAKVEALKKVEGSHVAEARARRWGGRPGRRFDSLAALKEAAALARQLGLPAEHRRELRDEAVACLALPVDVRPGRRWDCPTTRCAWPPMATHYAQAEDDHGTISVRCVADHAEVARLPGLDRADVTPLLGFSPDGWHLSVHYQFAGGSELRVWYWPGRRAVFTKRWDLQTHWVKWAPDSRHFVTFDHRLPAVDYRDLQAAGQVLHVETGAPVFNCAVNPACTQIALSMGALVQVRDLRTGKLLRQFAHAGQVRQVAWRGDGRLLAASCGRLVYAWRADSPARPLAVLKGHAADVRYVGFLPDGDLLVSSSWDGTTRFWDPHTGKELLTVPGLWPASDPWGVPGHRLLPADFPPLGVGFWEVEGGRELQTLHGYDGGAGAVRAVAFSRDGRLLVSGGEDGVRCWDADSGREVARLSLGPCASLALLGDAELLALGNTGFVSWKVRAVPPAGWDVGPPARRGPERNEYTGGGLSADGTGRKVAVADAPRGRAVVLDRAAPAAPPAVLTHPGIWAVALSPDGRWAATATYGSSRETGEVRVWDAAAGRVVVPHLLLRRAQVGFSPDGRWLVTSDAKAYRFWAVGTWKERGWSVPCAGDNLYGAGPVAFSPDGRLLAVAWSMRQARLVDGSTGRPLATLSAGDDLTINGFAFSPDGTRLAVALQDNTIQLWDLRALRGQLARIGLDWDQPPYPPAGKGARVAPLQVRGKFTEAAAEVRQAIALDPKLAGAHFKLGMFLSAQGKFTEAAAQYRQALALDPKLARAHYTLGNALSAQGKLTEAAAEYRQALRLKEAFPEAHCNLGQVLRRQGKLREALAELKRGHELGSRLGPRWKYPSAKWVRQCQRLLELDARLPAILRGLAAPASDAERIEFAQLCFAKRLYGAAARFFEEAFTGTPALAQDFKSRHRYMAAAAAALAGCGQGHEAGRLSEEERGRWRKQALGWLSADLALHARQIKGGTPQERATAAKSLQHWQANKDLAGIRDAAAVARLPADEQQACTRLWAEVDALLKKARGQGRR